MRAVEIPAELVAEIRRHGRETYPEECCGFLIALPDPSDPIEPRSIVAIQRSPNDFEGERRRRFVIRPEELRSAERALEGTDRVIAGFYHSHPDHPAQPSTFDQDHAWPWNTYVIVSVTANEATTLGAFELDADSGVFHEVPLVPTSYAEAPGTESLRAPDAR